MNRNRVKVFHFISNIHFRFIIFVKLVACIFAMESINIIIIIIYMTVDLGVSKEINYYEVVGNAKWISIKSLIFSLLIH